MKIKREIYGYLFVIKTERCENGFLATAPGVGGVYEEGKTKNEAIKLAYESASAILEARFNNGDLLTEDNEYIKVLRSAPNLSSLESNWNSYKMSTKEPYIITLPKYHAYSSSAKKAMVAER